MWQLKHPKFGKGLMGQDGQGGGLHALLSTLQEGGGGVLQHPYYKVLYLMLFCLMCSQPPFFLLLVGLAIGGSKRKQSLVVPVCQFSFCLGLGSQLTMYIIHCH